MRAIIFITNILFLASLLFSCKKENTGLAGISAEFYTPTIISANKDYTVEMISSANDTAFIMLNGGPADQLDDTQYRHLFDVFNQLSGLPFNVYSLLQAQMLNASIWKEGKNFTLKQAEYENTATLKMLEMEIQKLKNNNKKVFLIGHSFGGILLKKFLVQGTPSALNSVEKIVIMGARLNDDSKVIESIKNGQPCGYANGIFTCGEPFTEPDEFIRQKLILPIFSNTYTQMIEPGYLNKVIFVYGNQDEQGKFSMDEKDYLTNHNATLILWENEDHSSYIYKDILIKQILAEIRK